MTKFEPGTVFKHNGKVLIVVKTRRAARKDLNDSHGWLAPSGLFKTALRLGEDAPNPQVYDVLVCLDAEGNVYNVESPCKG